MELINRWQKELDQLARWVGITPPILRFGRVWWAPPSWSRKAGGVATFKSIIISEVSRDHVKTPMRYLLAHELGHIYHKHSGKILFRMLLGGSLGLAALYPWPAPFIVKLSLVAVCVFLSCNAWIMRREYQADEFAADLIGVEETMDGLETMGIITGTTNSKERRKRLAHLRRRTEAAEFRRSTEGIDI